MALVAGGVFVMTPDVSSKTLKDKRLPLHVVGQRAAAQKRFQGLKGLGALLMLVFLLFILHRFGPTATKHLQPAALQDAFHSAVSVCFFRCLLRAAFRRPLPLDGCIIFLAQIASVS